MCRNIYRDVYGAEFYLDGNYFKKMYGETYILKDSEWLRYSFVFTHCDLINIEYL